MGQDFMLGRASHVAQTILDDIATRATPIPGTMTCAEVERLLARDDGRSSLVAVRSDGRPFLVERLSFMHAMAGPVGYGRMLYHDRQVQDVLHADSLVLPADTTVGNAVRQLLTRPAGDRFRDLVVEFSDGTFGLLEATRLLERMAELNARAALHDPLTGLANRALLMESLEAALGSGQVWVALVFVDLDRFKVINDGLGHEAGDALLTTIADRIHRTVRDRGLATRLGGDEFAIAIQSESPGDLADLAESLVVEIVEVVRSPINVANRQVVPSASAGVAFAGPGDDSGGLLRRADIAMYQAKRAGGSQFRLFRGEQDHAAQRRLDIEIWLRHAFTGGGLRVAYQPIVELHSGRLEGFEALVRGNHPQLGALSPADFLPVAAEIGLMPEVDAWVLEEGLRQCARWHRRGATDLLLSVNLSSQTLARQQSLDRFEVVMERSEAPVNRLLLEITESEALNDLPTTEALLYGMRELGARIAIDDFGTGYSSLAQLATLPIDVLKIDQRFVQQLGSDARSEEMVRLIVSLAHGMRATTVAEGIELGEQVVTLVGSGCESGQGYLYAPALSEDGALAAVDRAVADQRLTPTTVAA